MCVKHIGDASERRSVSPQGTGRQGAMNLKRSFDTIAALTALVMGLLAAGAAAQAPDGRQGTGVPARAVRLSYVDGQVTLSQGNQVLASNAVMNTPLFEGAQLTTADSGKAEIQFEDGSVVRIAPDSSCTLQVLRGSGTSGNAVLSVNSGLVYFEFQGGDQAGQMSVHLGPTIVTTSGFTVLRVSMDTPPGAVAVFSGNAHLQIDAGSAGGAVETDLHGGEMITLNAADPNQYDVSESIEPDSWDAWNSDRDEALTAEEAAQTGVASNLGAAAPTPSWDQLDDNGNWYDVPGQGYIWSPYEAANAGFDPYGYGSWAWTPGFGYIWASGYPWGFLPFQGGMWNYYGGFGWGWTPGMGGYMPWWGQGYYGGPNIGSAPSGYQPVPKPMPPRHPIGHEPVPVISVNRQMSLGNQPLPPRNRATPVRIAGATVQAIRPLSTRQVYAQQTTAGNRVTQLGGRTGDGLGSRSLPGVRYGYNRGSSTSRQSYTSQRSGYSARSSASTHTNMRSYSSNRSNSSAGSGASHASGGSHGGGGGSHGGGGGGGGGHR